MEPQIFPSDVKFVSVELHPTDITDQTKSIEIRDCRCTDWVAIFQAISQLPNLRQLVCVNCNLEDSHVAPLADAKAKIEKLVLDSNNLSIHALKHFQGLSLLRELSIDGSPINEQADPTELLALLSATPLIKRLHVPMLRATKLGDGPFRLSWDSMDANRVLLLSHNLPKLERIDLSSCTLAVEQIANFLCCQPNLKSLVLDCVVLDGPFWARIAKSYPKLQELSAERCQINLDKITAMGSGFTELRVLSLSYNRLDRHIIQAIVKYFPTLESLDISHNRLGNQGVEPLSLGLHRLTSLNVEQCQIGPVGLLRMLEGLPNLKQLNINYNMLNSEVVRAMISRLKHLQYLNAQKTSITEYQAMQLGRKLPNMLGFSLRNPANYEVRNGLSSGRSFLKMKMVIPSAYISV